MKTPILAALFGVAAVLSSAAQTVDSVVTNRLAEPFCVAVEGNAYYITDSANDRIVKFAPDTGSMSTLAGFAGRPGSTDAKGVYARFYNPRGLVAVPARGGLVVSDYANHTLRLVKLDGTVTTLAGNAGQPGFEPGATPALAAHFNYPSALATDTAGNIYIADSKNNAIRKLDPANIVSTLVVGFNEPNGIALGDNGDLWIADSRDHTIKRLTTTGRIELAAGTPGLSGAVDSIFGNETLFNNPTALLWLGPNTGLLVCDTGNHALRRVFTDPEIGGYSVETYAGSLTRPGFVNGPALQARFNVPVGMTKDPAGGFLIADLGNNALRRIQISAPLPPVRDPVIGYVTFQKDQFGELLSYLVPVSQAVFNNDVIIAILAEPGTETYFRYGPTPSSSLEDTIPIPDRFSGISPPPYQNGLHAEEVAPSIIPPSPDVTIKAIGTQDNRRPSAVVQARFQFKTANPAILGDNAASFLVTNVTMNAQMWYTLDGSDPTINGPTSTHVVNGPVSLPRSTTPTTFKIRAFRNDYKDSEVVTKVFSPEDFQANRISFGFENGEGSSDFVAAAGQTFYAPVTLTLLPNQKMYTLQFSLTVTNNLLSLPVTPGAVGFASMLQWNIEKDIYLTIPPALFRAGQPVPLGIEQYPGFGNLLATNKDNNLLAVGWLERIGMTNLYDTTKQDLITYSIAHDTIFLSKNQKVIVGGYTFEVPKNAVSGDTYEIRILRPSATSDGINQDTFIEPVTDPKSPISSVKQVTVGQRRYVVGDVAPFRWFNAGDFGEDLLLNNDVVQVFQSAIYLLNRPPEHSDFFDAMDSSNGLTNAPTLDKVFYGDDRLINEIQFGDGQLNVDDVYVTFRRSLDPSLTWYVRYWENGERRAAVTDNVGRGAASRPGQLLSFPPEPPATRFIPGEPATAFAVEDRVVTAGQTLQIPVQARVVGSLPLRVLMLNLTVEPLEGAPPLTEPVEWTAAADLGTPALTASRGPANFGGAWLNNQVAGVAGETEVGYLKVTIPPNAPPTAAYRVHFDHLSGSPNGLGLFPKQTQDGVLTLQDRSSSSVGDGIPDTWRLRYFGSVSSLLARGNFDADGDGVSNLAEFRAGTNPVDATSRLRLAAHRSSSNGTAPRGLTLRWPSVLNKSYRVEAASSLSGGPWTILGSDFVGTGQELEFTPASPLDQSQFFRVRVSE